MMLEIAGDAAFLIWVVAALIASVMPWKWE